jgi:hypothetical protein
LARSAWMTSLLSDVILPMDSSKITRCSLLSYRKGIKHNIESDKDSNQLSADCAVRLCHHFWRLHWVQQPQITRFGHFCRNWMSFFSLAAKSKNTRYASGS